MSAFHPIVDIEPGASVGIMERVYVLQHETPETDDAKLIGVYSSEPLAQAAIDRLKAQPGFRDFPDGFAIDAYDLDADHWTEGFGSDG